MADLLYEIGVEEIPAGYIAPALDQLEKAIGSELETARLSHGEIKTVATPRRLTLWVSNILDRQPDAVQEALGPSVKAAFDPQGNPTKAAEGFARSQGISVSEIIRKETPRGIYCAALKKVKGRSALEVLSEILPRITLGLSFPKSMTWITGQRTFARPVRSLVALLGKEIIPFAIFTVTSGRATEGHPILSPGWIDLPDADFDQYKRALRERQIIVDTKDRKSLIRAGIEQSLKTFGSALREEALLDEVTNLVQFPSVSVCNFDREFLEVPAPVIEAAMMEHQRYFPVRDAAGKLLPHFLVVSDRGRENEALIRAGNERVLRARLADAQFFYQKDSRRKLADNVEALKGVAFLKGLGNYFDKTQRLIQLVRLVAGKLNLAEHDLADAARAAELCKADLLTEMVGEFPALQGEVGMLYALRDGESAGVAVPIAEHYMPRSADGQLPQTPAGQALSLAEKIDNLVSCFAAGLLPTGSADPYALRRQSQGILRIIEQSSRHFEISSLMRAAQQLLPAPHSQAEGAVDNAMAFLKDRLFQLALEERGAPHDLIHAALASGFDDICDFWLRLQALRDLAAKPCWQKLVISVERTHNISKALTADGGVAPELLVEPQEKAVWSQWTLHGDEMQRMIADRRYVELGEQYAAHFAGPLHEFFEKVFVNVEDEKLRLNRLRLMRKINRLFTERFADLSQIVTGVEK